jgi:carbon monoxide dehydrogenase subunit G
MKLESSFVVPVPSGQVMPRLLDAPTMEACIPGCTELVQVDEANYTGRLVNEVAHVRFNAAFSAEITARDDHEIKAILRGEDKKLASSLKLDATLRVIPEGDASTVSYAIEMAMWGKLGRMGESIFRRRTAEVEKEFVAAFTRACGAGEVGADTAEAAPSAARTATAVTAQAQPAETLRSEPSSTRQAAVDPGRRRRTPGRAGIWRRLVALLGRWFGRR